MSAAGDDEVSRWPKLLDYVTPAPGSELRALTHKVFGRVVYFDPLLEYDPTLQVRHVVWLTHLPLQAYEARQDPIKRVLLARPTS